MAQLQAIARPISTKGQGVLERRLCCAGCKILSRIGPRQNRHRPRMPVSVALPALLRNGLALRVTV